MRNDERSEAAQQPLLFALGLCAKAGRLIYGTPMITDALGTKRRPVLVVAASDNAKNSKKKLSDKCAYYGVLLSVAEVDGETLARAVGKTGRLSAVAVTEENLASLVKKYLPVAMEQNECE